MKSGAPKINTVPALRMATVTLLIQVEIQVTFGNDTIGEKIFICPITLKKEDTT